MEEHGERRRREGGGLIFGAILLLVGGYYLLRETLGVDIPDLDWDRIWPLIVVAIGLAIMYGAWDRSRQR